MTVGEEGEGERERGGEREGKEGKKRKQCKHVCVSVFPKCTMAILYYIDSLITFN